jgi:hypothetical protein
MHVKYSTPPTTDLLKSQTMAVIAMMRGQPKDGYHHGCSNRHYAKPRSYVCTIQPQDRTHLKQTTAVVGVMVNLRMVTTVVISTTQSISAGVLLDCSYNNRHLVFLTKDKPMMCPYSKKAGSTVVEYFEWELPKVLSQGGS